MVTAGAMLAYQLDSKRFNFPIIINALIDDYAPQLKVFKLPVYQVNKAGIPIQPSVVEQLPPAQLEAKSKGLSKEYIAEYFCKAPKKLTVKRAAGSKVYKWVDENGVTHFGDKRASNTVKNVDTISFRGRMNYFDLEIKSDGNGLPIDYKDKLSVHINKAYGTLSYLLPKGLLQKVQVNLWVFNDEPSYYAFQKQHAPALAGSSSGFHTSKDNIAAAVRRSDEQLLDTSVHEAVHVMNAGMFGYVPRWLNEGLAEYFETMQVYGQAVEISPDKRKLHLLNMAGGQLLLKDVLTSTFQEWNGSKRELLYANSWALVYFLLEKPQGKKALLEYLAVSAKDPCIQKDANQFFDKKYPGGIKELEERFKSWLLDDPIKHQY